MRVYQTFVILALFSQSIHCRRSIIDAFTAETNPEVAIVTRNLTKLRDGGRVDVGLVFLKKLENFHISLKLFEIIQLNDSYVKIFERKISVCRSGYKQTKDFVYQFIHSITQKYSNIPNCPVPPGNYYIRNWVIDSKVFMGIAATAEKTYVFNADYCSKEKSPEVDPCFIKVILRFRLKD